MAWGSPSQYDVLLFQAFLSWSRAIGNERSDPSGEYMVLDTLAASVTESDEDYLKALNAMREENAPGSRAFMYDHVALIMKTLRKHGHLDSAPINMDDGAEDFLST